VSSQLLARRQAPLPAIQLDAPPPETPGSVAWVAEAVFGGQRQFEDMLQSIVVGQGANGDYKWRQLVSSILKLRESGTKYNLNQLCQSLEIPAGTLLAFIGSAVREVQAGIAQLTASLAAPEVVSYALMAARDVEYGHKDRAMLLEMAGAKAGSGGGVNVNVQQNVAVKVGKEDLIAPLRQFKGVAEEIDSSVRSQDNVVEGEIVDGD
jgi:hypothetical protein